MPYGKWHRTPSSRTVCAILDRSRRMSRVIGALYRLLYDGILCRLPEPTAVALGQTALRLLPWDRLSVFRLDDPRLAVTLGGVRLPNPLILAAMYYDPRILRRAMGLGFGAVTTKSITVDPRPGHPAPNLARVRTAAGPGLVNCNGFQNRSEEHTSELQSRENLVCRLLLEKKNSVSKAAVFSLSQSLRALFADRGVNVHAVIAGPIDTDMVRDLAITNTSPESGARGIFDAV